MKSYIIGFFKNILSKSSLLALITSDSKVSSLARICRFAKVYKSQVGDYTYVGSKSWVLNTTIGKFCSIAKDCNIGLGSHTLDALSTSPIFTEKFNGTKSSWIKNDINKAVSLPVEIGNDVWIGMNVIIQSGRKVGDGAVIGAGSIVTKDVPPFAIVAGVPAKVIRYRFDEETICLILKSKWWEKSENELREKIKIFQKPNPSVNEIKQLL